MWKESDYRSRAVQAVQLAKLATMSSQKGSLLLPAGRWLELADRVHRPTPLSASGCNKADEETIFFDVCDEALERACGSCDASIPTLLGTYCFTCPAGNEIEI